YAKSYACDIPAALWISKFLKHQNRFSTQTPQDPSLRVSFYYVPMQLESRQILSQSIRIIDRLLLNQRKIDEEYASAGILGNVDGRVPIDEAAPCYKPSAEVVNA